MSRNNFIQLLFLIALGCSPFTTKGQEAPPPPYMPPLATNSIMVWDVVKPDTSRNNFTINSGLQSAKTTIQYFDGLGRPVQTVVRQGSLVTGGTATDLVSSTRYDAFGREAVTYLPFVANTTGGNASLNDGMFKYNPFQQDTAFSKIQYPGETWFYNKTEYEASSLNRPVKTLAPGNSWVGSNRGIETKYWFNTANDSVRIWTVTDVSGSFGTYSGNSMYPAGVLYKIVTIDEHGKQVIEFKDTEGLIVLKKVQLTAVEDTGDGKGYGGWINTYYIYDDLSRLRCVVQPRGVELLAANSWNINYSSNVILEEQAFRYEYDKKQRMIMKKVPGAGPEYFVYDARDRLVLTQDSMLRASGYWKYQLYDHLNRIAEIGSWFNSDDLAYHLVTADTSIVYPAGGFGYTTLSLNRYDNYLWVASGDDSVRENSYDEHLLSPSNTTWPYPQAAIQSTQVKGMLTGVSAAQGESTINLYDEKGRIIQTRTYNRVGGLDITSFQYAWNGSPLIKIQNHQRNDSDTTETTLLVTKMTYDDFFRLTKIEKKVGSNLVNNNAMTPYHVISEQTYNALGQLSSKKLGRKKDNEGEYTSSPLESLSYEYNIRGWLLGVNRPYLNEGLSVGNKFGYELAYDKRTSVVDNFTANTYNKAHYDGNIGGVMWRSFGDGERRKYDYEYDASDRILKADFTQKNGTWNVTNGVDFSMRIGDGIHADSAYDLNGNILSMYQKGLKISSSSAIDDLHYTYQLNSNKLSEVNDANNDPLSRMGDFKDYEESEGEADDYTYDGNGNLAQDKNKGITEILYNEFFHIPVRISQTTGTGFGFIRYYIDGIGNKTGKASGEFDGVTFNFSNTKYAADFTYTGPSEEANAQTLQMFKQEEGRVRFKPAIIDEGIPARFEFDYFIPDHLGSIRMVLTEEQQTDSYIPGSLETDNLEAEKLFYSGLDSGRVDKSTVSDYPSDPYTDPNDFIQKLDGDDYSIGANKTLKVMSGDKVNIRVNSWYKRVGGYSGVPSNPLLQLIASMTDGVGTISQAHTLVADELREQTINPLNNVINSFLDTEDGYDTSKPRAFINWVLFDEQFKFVSSGSGFEQVGTNDEFKTHTISELPITKNGYLYVYVSNQSSNVNVYFDNLQVTHLRGPLLDENHYYPFGLSMHGISSKALTFGDPENKRNKFQNQELNDDLSVNYYEFKYRNHDPQIGRFIQIDPLSDKYPHNSTYAFSENRVTNGIELEGLEFIPMVYPDAGNTRAVSNVYRSEAKQTPISQILADSRQEYEMKFRSAPLLIAIAMGPEVAIPYMLSEVSGVPITPSPQAYSNTVFNASENILVNSSDDLLTLENRANEIHSVLGSRTQRSVTTAVGTAQTEEGAVTTLVASSENALRPAQINSLKPGEVAVSGEGHAETTIMNYASANKMTVTAIGTNRPVCANCAWDASAHNPNIIVSQTETPKSYQSKMNAAFHGRF
jgi:RHS repeat-associated protein